jgi:hypothetical protein
MKPKNKFQKEVFEASKTLARITATQVEWANQNCFSHFGFRTKSGRVTCLECSYSWTDSTTEKSCICPLCKTKLVIDDTQKRVVRDCNYFCIITACKGFQVLRFFFVKYFGKAGNRADYYHSEVAQRWIAPDGRNAVIARMQTMSYYDNTWRLQTDLEIRPVRDYHNINPYCIYPHEELIHEVKRRGYNGMIYKITPFDFIHSLLTGNKAETLLKAGQTNLFYYFVQNDFHTFSDYWASIKICIRNGYQINDATIWCDYIDLLRFFGKDLHNAKYVCPADLKAEHGRYVTKKREWQEKQRMEEARKKAMADAARFNELKSRFFGIRFTDGLIHVRVLESVEEIMQEGDAMHHCVFTNNYHLKPESLILSAYIDDKRLETIELSLSKFKVLQSRGICNQNTEFHERIIRLVEKNISKIKKRLAA